MKYFFGVLGGMGTMATEQFIHDLNAKTPAHQDQDYLNYIVINHATMPDRTAYILREITEDPAEKLLEDINGILPMHPDFFVLDCNTAHYFHDELQVKCPVPILHMPRLAVEKINEMSNGEPTKVMILATSGTNEAGVYVKEFKRFDHLTPVLPDKDLQAELMDLIYHDVKDHNNINTDKYMDILDKSFKEVGVDMAIAGCTELSMVQDHLEKLPYPVVDAQMELIEEILRRQID